MKILKHFILFCLCICSFFTAYAQEQEKAMVIVIPSYNNIQWLEGNLESVINQNYKNYRVIYVDDASKDGTSNAVCEYLKENNIDFIQINFDDSENSIQEAVDNFNQHVNSEHHFFTLVRNVNRCGALANLYRSIHSCDDQEIIVTLDGDDKFYHNNVLNKLNTVYEGNVWFTHGTLMEYPWGHVTWCEPYPKRIIENRQFRTYKCPSHLRTFYTWLFKKIKLEDFLYNGDFFPMAWDMAIMFPLSEMAGERHAFISEVNYVYNMVNSINDNKVNPKLQNDLDYIIRHMPPYDLLPENP